jgi:hypothetical protein
MFNSLLIVVGDKHLIYNILNQEHQRGHYKQHWKRKPIIEANKACSQDRGIAAFHRKYTVIMGVRPVVFTSAATASSPTYDLNTRGQILHKV